MWFKESCSHWNLSSWISFQMVQQKTDNKVRTESVNLGTKVTQCFIQKQSSRDVLRKRCSEKMQQMCRIKPMPKRDLIKVALKHYWNHTLTWVFSCKQFSWELSFSWLVTFHVFVSANARSGFLSWASTIRSWSKHWRLI